MNNIRKLFINLADPTVFNSFGGSEYWERMDLEPGMTIVNEGEESTDFYYILSGSVDVSKSLQDEAGTEKHLATLSEGDFFGEGALLSDLERGATVRTKVQTSLYRLSQKSFERLVVADAQAAVSIVLGICKVLNARFMRSNSELVILHKVAQLSQQYKGNADAILPAIFKEFETHFEARLVLFGMDGLPKMRTSNVSQGILDKMMMAVPGFASRLSGETLPYLSDEDSLVFFAVRSLSGELRGVLVGEDKDESEYQMLITLAEQIGHVI